MSQRIGKAVERERKSAGMTAVQLSARCEELGLPIHRTTLSKIESGRSSFDVGELVVLAKALGVPPLELLYPGLPDAKVEGVPGQVERAWQVAQWFSGEASKDTLVGMVRRRDALQAEINRYKTASRRSSEPGTAVKYEAEIERLEQQLVEVEETIRSDGGVVDGDD